MSKDIIYPFFEENTVQLNKYVSLKLEDSITNIYVDKKLFRQCKSLMINIPTNNIERYNHIRSIDDLEQESLSSQSNLSPDDEFWGHCSNIQSWIENDYDTRILHYSLAFPLLRELTKLGDIKAKKIFKEEIISRFVSGSIQLKHFLLEEGFLLNYNSEEREIINEILEKIYNTTYFANKYFSEYEINLIFDKKEINSDQKIVRSKEFSKSFTRKYDHLQPIYKIAEVEELKNLTDITSLFLIQNYINEIEDLNNFTYLRELALNINEIKDIKNLDNLPKLKYLSLSGNYISKIEGLVNLTELEFLNLSYNRISKIEGLEHLSKLKTLNLWYNKIRVIEGLENLKDLRQLSLGGNNISKIQGLDNLKNLRILILNSNKITEITGLENLKHLKKIAFYNNKISTIQTFPSLPNLLELNLKLNPINRKETENIKKIIGTNLRIYF